MENGDIEKLSFLCFDYEIIGKYEKYAEIKHYNSTNF